MTWHIRQDHIEIHRSIPLQRKRGLKAIKMEMRKKGEAIYLCQLRKISVRNINDPQHKEAEGQVQRSSGREHGRERGGEKEELQIGNPTL